MTKTTRKLADIGIWIVRTSSASPKKGFGKYSWVAILSVDGSEGRYASQISTRGRGVLDVVRCSEKLHEGATNNSAAPRARASFQADCDVRNARTFRDMSRAAFLP
jgi:hypothetical protein